MSPLPQSNEAARIGEQLRLLYKGPSWLGPSLLDLVQDIDDAGSRRHLLPDAHTILELVLHITAWLRIARERLSAVETRDASAEEDWPAMDGSWENGLLELDRELNALHQAILGFPDERLQEKAPAEEEQTFYHLLHGVIQHSAYHAGQIALLKKLL